MKKEYTEEDILELQKIHRDNYKNIHNLIRNIFDKSTEENVKSDLMNAMGYVYSQEVYCQKDINISEKVIKKSESDTCNNNSL